MNKILHWLTEFHKFLAFNIVTNLCVLYLPLLLFKKSIPDGDYNLYSLLLFIVVSPQICRKNIINCLVQHKKYFSYAVIAIFLVIGLYFAFGEKNYNDCILNHVKSTASAKAIEVLESACEEKYGYY